MAQKIDAFQKADVLLVCFSREIRFERHNPEDSGPSFVYGTGDPIWESLLKRFNVPNRNRHTYQNALDSYLPELQNHELVKEEQDARWTLHPETDRLGDFFEYEHNGLSVICFRSRLRLNTGGMSFPVIRLLEQIIKEVRPSVVCSMTLGASVGDCVPGDALFCKKSSFGIGPFGRSSKFRGVSLNKWEIDGEAGDLLSGSYSSRFPKQRSILIRPPSPNYDIDESYDGSETIEFQPSIKIEKVRPLLTSPRLSEDLMHLPSPDKPDKDDADYIRESFSCSDMDGASAMFAASGKSQCLSLVGISIPALRKHEVDYQGSRLVADEGQIIRKAWAETYQSKFSRIAADNVAMSAKKLLDRISES